MSANLSESVRKEHEREYEFERHMNVSCHKRHGSTVFAALVSYPQTTKVELKYLRAYIQYTVCNDVRLLGWTAGSGEEEDRFSVQD